MKNSKLWSEIFFVDIYADDHPPYRPFLLPVNCYLRLANNDMDTLATKFTGCEIKETLFDMQPYKAPSPDGFQALFYQRFWDLTGNKLTRLVCTRRQIFFRRT